jgi:uncharacterized protein with GYD domain
MPKYMFMGSYTKETMASLVDSPEDRSVAARKLAESVGGKLETYYWAFGPEDWVAIADLPNDEAAGAVSLAVSSSGVTGVRTTKLITMDEALAMLRKAKQAAAGFAKPGAATASRR